MLDNVLRCSGEAGINHETRVMVFGQCSACGGTDAPQPTPVVPTPPQAPTPRTPTLLGMHTAGENIYVVTRHENELTGYYPVQGGWR